MKTRKFILINPKLPRTSRAIFKHWYNTYPLIETINFTKKTGSETYNKNDHELQSTLIHIHPVNDFVRDYYVRKGFSY